MSANGGPLLEVSDLHVEFPTEDGVVHAVDGISYTVERGQTLCIVGESGSGKTVSSLTTLGLTQTQGAQVERQHHVRGPRPAEAGQQRDADDPRRTTSR